MLYGQPMTMDRGTLGNSLQAVPLEFLGGWLASPSLVLHLFSLWHLSLCPFLKACFSCHLGHHLWVNGLWGDPSVKVPCPTLGIQDAVFSGRLGGTKQGSQRYVRRTSWKWQLFKGVNEEGEPLWVPGRLCGRKRLQKQKQLAP